MGERVGVRKRTSEKERKRERERRERPVKWRRQETLICLIDDMTVSY